MNSNRAALSSDLVAQLWRLISSFLSVAKKALGDRVVVAIAARSHRDRDGPFQPVSAQLAQRRARLAPANHAALE
jgi:hypothetical protein